jgi:hypothetical protein
MEGVACELTCRAGGSAAARVLHWVRRSARWPSRRSRPWGTLTAANRPSASAAWSMRWSSAALASISGAASTSDRLRGRGASAAPRFPPSVNAHAARLRCSVAEAGRSRRQPSCHRRCSSGSQRRAREAAAAGEPRAAVAAGDATARSVKPGADSSRLLTARLFRRKSITNPLRDVLTTSSKSGHAAAHCRRSSRGSLDRIRLQMHFGSTSDPARDPS